MGMDDEQVEPEHADAVALALGQVDGDRRAAMAAHILACAECRRDYDEAVGVVGELLPAVPAVQPEIGFDERVLARLGVERPPARRRRWLAGLAAIAAAAVILAVVVGGWLVLRSDDADDAVAALELSDGGAPVGTVSVSEVDGRRMMVVAIVDAPEDVSYTCRTTLSDGVTVTRIRGRPEQAPGSCRFPTRARSERSMSSSPARTGCGRRRRSSDLGPR